MSRVRPWRSLQAKIAISYFLVIAGVLLLLNTYPLMVSRDLVMASKHNALQSQAALFSSSLAALERLQTGRQEQVEQVISLLDDGSFSRIIVTDPAGYLLYDSDAPKGSVGPYVLYGEIVEALHGSGQDVFRCEYRDGVFLSCAASPIVYRNVVIGAVCLYERDTEQGSLLVGVQSNLRGLSVTICAAALILSLFFSQALTARMNTLLGAIRKVREGEYSHRVEMKGNDELAVLGEEFDQLTRRLQTTEEVRRRFVSDASHELKTPLATIQLLSDSILQTRQIDPETTREFVTDIGEEAQRLTRITEKLLTLTRLDSAVPTESEPVELGYVVERVEHMLRPLAEKAEVTLECSLAEGCLVRATQDDLYQICFNLMENAVKYNLPGGKVMVTLTADSSEVLLRVEDTGVGIPEEDMPKIFDRFYRVDKARSREAGGTGLGLSIVRDTARQYGGRVSVRGRDGERGSCFEVRFPRCKEAEE